MKMHILPAAIHCLLAAVALTACGGTPEDALETTTGAATAATSTKTLIAACVARNGGQAAVGTPFDNGGGVPIHDWGPGQVRDYEGGTLGPNLCMLENGQSTAWMVRGSIRDAYFAAGGGSGSLGYPVEDEHVVNASPFQQFKNGSVQWNGAGFVAVTATPPSGTPPSGAPPSGTAPSADFYHPFGPDSIWNRRIPSDARYVAANLGPLGAIQVDPEYLIQTQTSDRLVNVLQENSVTNVIARIHLSDGINIQQNGNNAASILDIDGHTTLEFNAFQRVIGSTFFSSDPYAPVGYAEKGSDISADDLTTAYGGHSGSGLSALGGSIRYKSTENNDVNHALKVELDFGQLYKSPSNTANENGTFRWPAIRSDGNFPGQSGNPPPYFGTNPALTMGSLLAIPPTVDVNQLGLSSTGLLLARALQTYGAYVVDTTDNGGNTYHVNGGYRMNICVESGENPGYFKNAINQDNSSSESPLYHDFVVIYSELQVVDSNNQ